MSDTNNIKIRNKAKRKLSDYRKENELPKFFSTDHDAEVEKIWDERLNNGSRYGNKRKYEAGMKVFRRRSERKKQKNKDINLIQNE